ncbi:hypothetical protein H112_06054 [Trichophyton rubrum D6]|uniref:Uncharacterized protein n=4 Tax=Trichophyton TaxID=5550 RepID=A0A178ET12_TRIRU|nr:uncharacterized protein TERG_03757 [Trichophyton rubrum CBS 118892]EZF14891.1 hypothetical protein H100_06069 [Trichophyton rubrum MR850]EZF39871.1 hypothetical protein H102_06037 [Trichophyton rubrum CBS 100081]EZF50554.1 hypothetical protein H103_06061 [Trichophyton rubrum CBS 288.86]EZF61191.1 hypothetical protein H104_06050 [Trichophyton rubrum CBS 289.86]EZF71822.1 hypothetical protein H105_06075 [Trichophyton soudanense CBS 452.61]EZF82404.1 hypothetical protein H110_06058 [Trichophy
MPELCDITYSREECIAAVRGYYQFLTAMYLKESDILEPPEGGWPSVTPSAIQQLGKTNEVAALLRHLPYIRNLGNGKPLTFPCSQFENWEESCMSIYQGRLELEGIKECSEGHGPNDVPPHVIGLTSGGRINYPLLLDTELGVIYWPECPGDIQLDSNAPCERVWDDPYEYASMSEAEWRAEGAYWSIPDFFEIIKDQFRRLLFIPISTGTVIDVYNYRDSPQFIQFLQEIYREHGWPDLEKYNKLECLKDIQKRLTEKYPEKVDYDEALNE